MSDFFTARRNARIASAVLAIAIPSVSPSVRLSVTLSYIPSVSLFAVSNAIASVFGRKKCPEEPENELSSC